VPRGSTFGVGSPKALFRFFFVFHPVVSRIIKQPAVKRQLTTHIKFCILHCVRKTHYLGRNLAR
jgi:hypothetical protein